MFVGNVDAQGILKGYLEKIAAGNKDLPNFLLLQGNKHLGKSSLTRSMVRDLLGSYFQNDFLHIRDLSREIGKIHNLKISLPDDRKKQFIELSGGQIYQDLGTREISHWLQQSSSGNLKVVLIENIERMTIGAANAFLKTAEEALPGRIIIATTGNASALLDTIISRALLVKFQPLVLDELIILCDQQNIFSENTGLRELVVRMVMGKPGLLMYYAKIFSENKDLAKEFVQLVDALKSGDKIYQPHRLFLTLKEEGMLEGFVDAWIAYATDLGLGRQADSWLKVKKMMKSNVNVEHLLMYGLLG